MGRLCITFVFLLCIYAGGTQNLTPDDEEFTTGSFNDFLTYLERQSGLSTLTPTYKVTRINCPNFTECTVNPNGNVLWDVRANLYKAHLMQSKEDEESKKVSLDGCLLNNPTDLAAYNACMNSVRTAMRIYLVTDFNTDFKNIIEADCSLEKENCITVLK